MLGDGCPSGSSLLPSLQPSTLTAQARSLDHGDDRFVKHATLPVPQIPQMLAGLHWMVFSPALQETKFCVQHCQCQMICIPAPVVPKVDAGLSTGTLWYCSRCLLNRSRCLLQPKQIYTHRILRGCSAPITMPIKIPLSKGSGYPASAMRE